MRSFDQLTWRGKARRLRRLAQCALEHYDLEVADLRLLGMFTNALFRLRTTSGRSYVMRVCTPGWRTLTDLRSEIAWLLALDRDTEIGAPVPIPARNGAFYVEAGVEGVPEARRCLVTTWIPGVPLGKRLTEDNLFKMGELFARMHRHGARFDPPPGFTALKMDRVCARGEEDLLLSDACRDAFTPRTREILERTTIVVRQAFERLYADPEGLQVIHNDLWHDNIKVDRGRLRPLDFEDTVWGYPVQDIAMALQDLMMDVEADAYEPLQLALREGYERELPWSARDGSEIDTFRAGRLLWVANYVARYEREHLRQHVDWTSGLLEPFLATGKLRKV